MTQYFFTIPILFMTLICMLFLTATTEQLLPSHKKGFLVVFSGSFITTASELFSILLNDSSPAFKAFHFLSNYLGFLITPILILFFAAAMGRFTHLKEALIGIGAYFVLYNVLVITKQLFFIDSQNHYHRGSLFFLYIICYFCAILYLLYEALHYSRNGFTQHKIFAYLLSFFFLLSTSIQVFNPEVYTTRIAVVLCLCICYAYNNELTNLFDKLTGLLNQGTYLMKTDEIKEGQTVIILDIDRFKEINDRFGHLYGDKSLRLVARTIKSVFKKHGQCYRIGGDEFAVILKKRTDTKTLIARFEKAIEEQFKDAPCRLSLSLGYSKFEKGETAEAVIRRADQNMYLEKSRKKSK